MILTIVNFRMNKGSGNITYSGLINPIMVHKYYEDSKLAEILYSNILHILI